MNEGKRRFRSTGLQEVDGVASVDRKDGMLLCSLWRRRMALEDEILSEVSQYSLTMVEDVFCDREFTAHESQMSTSCHFLDHPDATPVRANEKLLQRVANLEKRRIRR